MAKLGSKSKFNEADYARFKNHVMEIVQSSDFKKLEKTIAVQDSDFPIVKEIYNKVLKQLQYQAV